MLDLFAIAALACVLVLVLVVSLSALEHHTQFDGASRICISICVACLSVVGIAQDMGAFLIPAAALGITILVIFLFLFLFLLLGLKNASETKPVEEARRSARGNRPARRSCEVKSNRERKPIDEG